MKTLSLPKLPNIKVSSTVLLVTAGVLIILAIVCLGAVQKVKDDRAEAAATAQAEADRKAKEAAKDRKIAVLESQVKQLQAADTVARVGCAEFRRLDAIRAITNSVTVPAYCVKY